MTQGFRLAKGRLLQPDAQERWDRVCHRDGLLDEKVEQHTALPGPIPWSQDHLGTCSQWGQEFPQGNIKAE